MPESKVIVALDYHDSKSALALTRRLSPEFCHLKVGMELYTACGPDIVATLQKEGFRIFLDLKFHDIPNTVSRTCRVAAELGVWMLNVHALGGREMLLAAREGIEGSRQRPLLIGVTILTSHKDSEVRAMGLGDNAADAVDRLASQCAEAGLDGVVCSAHEATRLRAKLGKKFVLVMPGIRPPGSAAGDQQRIMTPRDAVAAGSSYLVVGRPVTGAGDPVAVLESINTELG